MRVMQTATKGAEAPQPKPAALAYRIGDAVYLNVTSRCSLRCGFCPKFHGLWTVEGTRMRLPATGEPQPSALIAAARALGPCVEYVFCGLGEPTTRLAVVLSVASVLKGWGVPVRLNTDGLANLVHGYDVVPEFRGLIDHVSISLNAADELVYKRLCRPKIPGSYAAMLSFARRCLGIVPKVTLTAIDGLEGVDIGACAGIARGMGAEFRARPLELTDGRTFRVR